jgi:hypothetical protein
MRTFDLEHFECTSQSWVLGCVEYFKVELLHHDQMVSFTRLYPDRPSKDLPKPPK